MGKGCDDGVCGVLVVVCPVGERGDGSDGLYNKEQVEGESCCRPVQDHFERVPLGAEQ